MCVGSSVAPIHRRTPAADTITRPKKLQPPAGRKAQWFPYKHRVLHSLASVYDFNFLRRPSQKPTSSHQKILCPTCFFQSGQYIQLREPCMCTKETMRPLVLLLPLFVWLSFALAQDTGLMSAIENLPPCAVCL